jgi:nucleotide-binding universal stress UspA family protein
MRSRRAVAAEAEEDVMPSQGYVAVVGIDFSDMSNKALDQALEVTNLRAGEVHVVYVESEALLDPLLPGSLQSAVSAEAVLEGVRQRAAERLAVVQKQQGKLAVKRVVVHVRRGSPADEIAQLAADLDADLVVVGSHGRRGVSRLVLGSVAERVSRLARCAVWIIRPKAHEGGERIPEIEPPCPACVKHRAATNGAELWCSRHSEHHIRAHGFKYVTDSMIDGSAQPYEATPERGA